MNCKQGDLAIVVRSKAGNEGKICTCLKLHPPGYDGMNLFCGPIWETDIKLNTVWNDDGSTAPVGRCIPDENLRPIRDNPGQDETLTWAPHKETA